VEHDANRVNRFGVVLVSVSIILTATAVVTGSRAPDIVGAWRTANGTAKWTEIEARSLGAWKKSGLALEAF
jgi:hypothetical protein